jgi:hypothetical protein
MPARSGRQDVPCQAGGIGAHGGLRRALRLAQLFGVHNLEFTQVSGEDGSTLMASVLFPSDPKRRLEVLWDDDMHRAGTRVVVINGESTGGTDGASPRPAASGAGEAQWQAVQA